MPWQPKAAASHRGSARGSQEPSGLCIIQHHAKRREMRVMPRWAPCPGAIPLRRRQRDQGRNGGVGEEKLQQHPQDRGDAGCRQPLGPGVKQQHPGMEDAVVPWVGDAWCRQPWCWAESGGSLPSPCINPAHTCASVSPSEQGRAQAFWACREKSEPGNLDEPRKDLAIGTGSILLALQIRAGCKVHPYVCQGTPGILCQQPGPAWPLNPTKMGGTAAAFPHRKGVWWGQNGAP